MSGRKVLVVDDDAKTVELVKLYLVRDGYKVFTAAEGNEALALARKIHPDLMVLDLMLPGVSGLEICRIIKNEFDVLVIMLTARTTEEDKLTGLEVGADDYMTKPFSPRELAARVRAVLRRFPEETLLRGPEAITRGDLTINFTNREAAIKGKSLKLTPIEFKILGVMAREPGRVFSREQLIEMVFGYNFEGFDRTVDVHILNLRRKLEADSGQPKHIRTVYGAGYKFNGIDT